MSTKRPQSSKSTASIPPAAAAAQEPVVPKPRPPLSRRRKWLYRLTIMILAPVLFFTVLEAGLRLGGYGYPTTFFIGPEADGSYRTNPEYGRRFFPQSFVQVPVTGFVSTKAAGAIRIFVFGSSAAQGLPNPSFGFGRILEVLLRERYPDVKFEVINAAMTGINSHVTLDIARDCAAHEPDLFVVYMGNNEVIGPYGPGTIFQRSSPSLNLIRSSIWVKSTRVGQWLGNVVQRFRGKGSPPASRRNAEMPMGTEVAAHDPGLAAAYDNFRQNLIDLCRVARRAGAPLLLSTVAVNLRDFAPLGSEHRPDLSPEKLAEWDSIYQAAVDLDSKGGWEEAPLKYEAAAQIDDRFAELQFRLGRCLAIAGRSTEARDRFILARDLDVLRFRADSRINAIIREVSAEEKISGVHGVDAEQALADSDLAVDGIPGAKLFYEHVHLTFDGNYLLARAFLDQIEAALPQLAASRKEGPVASRQECAEALVLTPFDEFQMAAYMVRFMSRPPFTDQMGHAVLQASLQKQAATLHAAAFAPQAVATACERYEAALEKSPDDWDLHLRYGMLAMDVDRPQIAVKHLRIALEKLPWHAATHVNLSSAALSCGQIDEAIEHARKALEINPLEPMAYNSLGNALNERGQFDEAVAAYQKALEIEPNLALAHSNFAAVLFNHGQIDEAITHLREALRLEPSNPKVRNDLDMALKARGDKRKSEKEN